MADDPTSLAQAAARIGELERELVEAVAQRDAALAAQNDLNNEIARLTAALEPVPALERRVVELERLLAPPPDDSGITKVELYRTRDGATFAVLPDAQSHQGILPPAELRLQARITELEQLLAPPPDSSGITRAEVYRTRDGASFAVLPDAQRHLKVLALLATGMTPNQAEAALMRGNDIVEALST
jgi:hypothetical protein